MTGESKKMDKGNRISEILNEMYEVNRKVNTLKTDIEKIHNIEDSIEVNIRTRASVMGKNESIKLDVERYLIPDIGQVLENIYQKKYVEFSEQLVSLQKQLKSL